MDEGASVVTGAANQTIAESRNEKAAKAQSFAPYHSAGRI